MTVRTVSTHLTRRPAGFAAQESSTPWCAVIVLAAAAIGLVLAVYLGVHLWRLVG